MSLPTPPPQPRYLRNPTTRFSNRAEAYHSSRPSLPAAIIDAVLRTIDCSHCTIADLGAGTGLSALAIAPRLTGNSRILAIEPNADMRAHGQAQSQLQVHGQRIGWLDATAEATGLESASVDVVISVTAFHWFHPERAPREVARILRPGGRLAVMATDRQPADPIAHELHCLMGETELGISPANIHQWYGHAFTPTATYTTPELVVADNPQDFELPRLLARAQSSSYWPTDPAEQQAAHDGLNEFHRRHADSRGVLRINYSTIALIADRLAD